jgi:hypothetical protein
LLDREVDRKVLFQGDLVFHGAFQAAIGKRCQQRLEDVTSVTTV